MSMETTAQTEGSPYIPGWTFGDKIRKARRISGLDQREFAARLGLNASTVAAYEGDRAAPRLRDASQLAGSLQMLTGIDRAWFLDFDPPTTPSNPSKKITNRSFASDHRATVTPIRKDDAA
jgi:transcriptional regulator with XRE-family HTH domain